MRMQVRHGPDTYGASLTWETPEQAAAATAAASARLDALYARVMPQRHDPPPRISSPAGSTSQAPPAAMAPLIDVVQASGVPSGGWGGLTARVELDASDQGLAAGQYAVLYDAHGACFGCGVILGDGEPQ